MSDNVLVTPGSGASIATDQIGSDHYQWIKLGWGPDDSITKVDSAVGKGLPIQVGLMSTYHKIALATDNAASIKGAPAVLRGVHAFNKADYPIYIKLHNTAGAPVAGVGVVVTVGVQAGQRADVPFNRAFSTGLGITVVKDLADAGTTAVAAGDSAIEVNYE